MATILRDYGAIGINTVNNVVEATPRRQVYQATHRGDGIRLPYMNRSFISFTYGGKFIEDFDLIATITGDRMNRNGYATFEDTVSSYDNLDGLHYWTTHYKTNLMDFILSTDGIDLKKLDDFLHWFKAGISRELILSEHPNRAIMARVALPPVLNLLPFEQSIMIKISGVEYPTKTTLYKGDIQLSLVMDQPYWYAIVNILGKKVLSADGNSEVYIDKWDDPFTGRRDISIFASLDALKILYEDGIPLGSMIEASMLLGNGAYALINNSVTSLIWDEESETNVANSENLLGGGACIDGTYNNVVYKGMIAGSIVDLSGNGITSLSELNNAYFFYAGTAPAATIIKFTLTPLFSRAIYSSTDKKIITPRSKNDNGGPNYFAIESTTKLYLYFTTPNIWTSYNKAMDVFHTYTTGEYTWNDISTLIRNLVHHSAIRMWAIKCIEYVKKHNGDTDTLPSSTTTVRDALKDCMLYVLLNKDNTPTAFPATFTFNSETGDAIGEFLYRLVPASGIPNSDAAWKTYGEISPIVEEDVGDMVLSNYITILERNYANANGKILAWESTNEETKRYSHRISHDVEGGLHNILILYKNMYL